MQSMDIDFELHENGKNDVKVPFDEGEESDNPFEDSDDEEIKIKRQQFLDALYQRDVLKKEPVDEGGQKLEYGTIKTRDLMNPLKRGVKLTDVAPINFPVHERWEPFPFPASDPSDDPDAPSILDISSAVPECLAIRQSYVTKYLRGIQRCIKENVYDYKSVPEFDAMYEFPDKDIPTLAEAIAKEKEEKMKLFRRDSDRQAEKDRNLMPPPPPPVPQTPSSDDAASPFPNGQTATVVPSNNGPPPKDETPSEKKFVCKVEGCTKSYKNWQGLKNHMKREHPDVTLPSKLSHSEESILATALGGNAPPRLPPPPVNQRLPPIPTNVQHQRPQPPQQPTTPTSRPITPQQSHTPQRYDVQPSPLTSQPPQQPQPLQQQPQQTQYHPLSQQQAQQPQLPQPHVQYIPISQGYTTYPQQVQQTQTIPPQQQQARLPAAPPQMQATQVYQQAQIVDSPQSATSEYASATASPHSVMSQESIEEVGNNAAQSATTVPNRRMSSKPVGPIATKIKCSHCSKSYKTQQNLIKHMRDLHPNVSLGENEIAYAKPPPHTQTFYLPASSSTNRQEMVYVEQIDPNSLPQETRSTPVTIVRQQQPMHVTEEPQSQGVTHVQHGQIITSQSGSPVVQYQLQQVQPARQQPMEIDSPQQQTVHHTYGTPQGTSPDVIMIDSTPPATPRNTMAPIITSVEQPQHHQQTQQVYIQNGQQLIRAPSGQQIIRHQGRNVQSYISQPVHIIQQPFGANTVEKYVVYNPQQTYRPRTGQQIIRGNQQVVSSQGGTTYVYNQPSQSVTTRYYTTSQRPMNAANAATVSTNIPISQSMEGHMGGETNDYYSTPPQLTPQQALPSRSHRPQHAYQVYNRRAAAPTQVKIPTVANPGQKAVKYAVQVPAGNVGGQAYIAQGIQYVRAQPGSMPQGNAVKFISAPLKVTNTQRGGQQTQQYSGQPSGFAARPQTYTSVRPQGSRVRLATMAHTGQRRPARPLAQPVHQQLHGPPQEGSSVQIQRYPAPQPPTSSSTQPPQPPAPAPAPSQPPQQISQPEGSSAPEPNTE